MPLGPASTLAELHESLSPEPLRSPQEMAAFYSDELNAVRGVDHVARIAARLQRSGGAGFKGCLIGHPGAGKSTEITRLADMIGNRFRTIRLSAVQELSPSTFRVFDVLLIMMVALAEESRDLTGGGDDFLRDVLAYFNQETLKRSETRTTGGEAAAGIGMEGGSLWEKLFGLTAKIRGEVKYSAQRSKEVIEYHFNRLSTLVELVNRLAEACSSRLRETRQEWLVVFEDFDKEFIPSDKLREVFIHYGGIIPQLRLNMLFTIPAWLTYSDEANRLPFGPESRFMIHDIPVYDPKHQPHAKGLESLETILLRRVTAALFAEGQMNRLMVASGGILRDLFAMVYEAGERALLRGKARIEGEDAGWVIDEMRRRYRQSLGVNPHDREAVPYEGKARKLVEIYRRKRGSEIPDKVTYSLLRSRAVQEFDGKGWLGVHPLVVDILKEQRRLKAGDAGGTE